MYEPENVVFVCTHSSGRSHMAGGFRCHHAGDSLRRLSAGTEPGSPHPLAVRTMVELGIDISGQFAK